MKSVIVTKGGSVFRTRSDVGRASSSGEQGETEGLLRHLLARGDLQVVYFGYYRGEQLPGLSVVEPTSRGLSEWSLASEQEERFRVDEQNVEAVLTGDVVGYFNVAGYAPTFSCIGNPKGVTVQQCNVLYTAPMLNMIRHFKAPRIVVNNDPRSYPKDQEMTLMWPEVVPAVLLDQCGHTTPMVVGGKQYSRVSRYAACESWSYMVPERMCHKRTDCQVVAHAHMKDGTRQKGRDASWTRILDGWKGTVYGTGWEHFSGYDPELFPGTLSPEMCLEVFRQTRCMPVTACGKQFYTGKPYLMLNYGCLPMLYGDGEDPYTWDPYGKHVALDSELRVYGGDLSDTIALHVDDYDELLPWYEERFKPDFTVLDALVDDLPNTEGYGGYR